MGRLVYSKKKEGESRMKRKGSDSEREDGEKKKEGLSRRKNEEEKRDKEMEGFLMEYSSVRIIHSNG